MRFLADMGISISTVTFLRESGHDVIHLRDLGMQKASDSQVVEFALRENRYIITIDLDFGSIIAASKKESPSTLIFRLQDWRPSTINEILRKTLPLIEKPLKSGSILIIEHNRYRIRKLPISA